MRALLRCATFRTFPFDVLPELADLLRRQRLYTEAFEAVAGKVFW